MLQESLLFKGTPDWILLQSEQYHVFYKFGPS